MKNQNVIVTGGSSGIGRATALEFAQKGANVLITGRRLSSLEEVANQHENIVALVADSADPASANLIVEKALTLWGKIDVLVNNAGAGLVSPLEAATEKQINDLFAINVTASSLLATAAIPHLRASKGSIVNVTSAIGHKPSPHLSHYGASKAALEYLTRAWSLELAPDIRVNAVSPGPTDSGALTGMMGLSEEQAQAVQEQEKDMIPLKRRGVPEDISRWIVMLADPETAWVTGQVIDVDGGFAI
ncbi:SDR family oxidoreductase [Marinomonas agarivorans]|nr:SDR family oxidoreductase [Marinomonas agarivorans]